MLSLHLIMGRYFDIVFLVSLGMFDNNDGDDIITTITIIINILGSKINSIETSSQ